MTRFAHPPSTFLLLLCAWLASACTSIPSSPAATTQPVFAGAIGYGTDTQAGRGGIIVKVTNLNNAGPGSLRAALDTKGPRIVVFEVGGVIDLDRQDLKLREPFVTIAGHTAPSPGITLIRGGMKISTHDVLMQHIRFRMGDAGLAKKSGYENDVSIEGADAYNVVVDHCSVAWGTDENLSVSGPRYDGPGKTARKVTLSHNIIAEGLEDSTHEKGAHSMGTLIHDHVQDVAVIGNLYAHNEERNPWFKGNATGVIVNNFLYNPGKWPMRLGYVPGEWKNREFPPKPRVSIVGNFMQAGANTPADAALVGTNYDNGEAFMEDNIALKKDGSPAPLLKGGVTVLGERPAWLAGLKPIAAAQVREAVLAKAGARPKDRDAVDLRLIADIRAGRGGFIDSQNDVGGYPQVTPGFRALDVPKDDIDGWLERFRREVE